MLAMANLAATGQLAPEWPVLASYSDLVGRLRVFANTGVDPALVEAHDRRAVQRLHRPAVPRGAAGDLRHGHLDRRRGRRRRTGRGRPAGAVHRDAPRRTGDGAGVAVGAVRAAGVLPPGSGGLLQHRRRPLCRAGQPRDRGGRPGRRRPGGAGAAAGLVRRGHQRSAATAAGSSSCRTTRTSRRGEQIQLDQLQPATRLAYLQVAAHVVDNFALGQLGTAGCHRAPRSPAPAGRDDRATGRALRRRSAGGARARPARLATGDRPARPGADRCDGAGRGSTAQGCAPGSRRRGSR